MIEDIVEVTEKVDRVSVFVETLIGSNISVSCAFSSLSSSKLVMFAADLLTGNVLGLEVDATMIG